MSAGDRPWKRVLVWDAPNIDMTITELLGRRPQPGDRPDMRLLRQWLAERAQPGEQTEACVFVNVPAEPPPGLRNWISFLLSTGYRVWARPRAEGSDVDEDMLRHVEEVAPGASEIVVGSNDQKCFLEPLRKLRDAGARITVLGFAEVAGEMSQSDGIEFVDLEDVPGLLPCADQLVRVRLDRIPQTGGWLEPRSPTTPSAPSAPGAEEAKS